jgi:tetratricopeptide (TPR) repeat protein
MYNDVLEITEKYGRLSTHLDCLSFLGNLLIETGEPSEAEKYLEKSLKIARSKKLTNCQFWALQNLVLLSLEKKEFIKVKEYSREMVSIAEKIDSKDARASVLSVSGQVHLRAKAWERALSSFEKALHIYEEIGNPGSSAKMKYFMGLTLSRSGQKDKAKEKLSEAMKTFESIGARKWRGRAEKALSNS